MHIFVFTKLRDSSETGLSLLSLHDGSKNTGEGRLRDI